MAAPLISIVITNYNYARFLPDAIDSALSQTYAPAEVVVVDDGSSDGSAKIIAGYGTRLIPVLKANGGMASGYNAGLSASRGEIILFLDSDDSLLPSAAEEIARAFERLGCAKVHWPLWQVDEKGARTGGIVPSQALAEGDFREATIVRGPDCYLSPPTSGNAWSRRVLQSILPMPEKAYRQHADSYLATLAPLFGEVRRIATPQAQYRLHSANDYATKAADEKNRRNLAIFEQRCRDLSSHLSRLGISHDPDGWKKNNPYYEWMRRLEGAMELLEALIPAGETFILADEDQWTDRWGGSETLTGRRSLPCLERNGQYWGPPADDQSAIAEVLRLRSAGATFLVFAWPAFWWLEHYAGLAQYLHASFPCLLRNQDVMVFDLRTFSEGAVSRTAPGVAFTSGGMSETSPQRHRFDDAPRGSDE